MSHVVDVAREVIRKYEHEPVHTEDWAYVLHFARIVVAAAEFVPLAQPITKTLRPVGCTQEQRLQGEGMVARFKTALERLEWVLDEVKPGTEVQ